MVASFCGFRNPLYYMRQLDFPARIAQASHQPTSDERYDRKPNYDADSRSTLRAGVHRIYLPAPVDAQAWTEVQTRLSLRLQPYPVMLYTGMQWKCLPVQDSRWKRLKSITQPFTEFSRMVPMMASLDQAFIASVKHIAAHGHLDLNVPHGDGTNTVAKKGGDGDGYSGHKHQKGEKILAIIDNNGFVLAPLPVAPANEADTVLLPEGLNALKRMARLAGLKIGGSYLNLDGGFWNSRKV